MANALQFLCLFLRCVNFYYHKYGSGYGFLNLYVATASNPQPTVPDWTANTAQANLWISARYEATADQDFWIIFEGIKNINFL